MAKLLLVERTGLIKMRLEKLFRKLGFTEIVTYDEGVLPFDKFYNLNGEFNAIIIDADQFRDHFDIMMNTIRANNKKGDVRTIVLTDKTDVVALTHFITNGVDDVILKPFSDDAIIKKLSLHKSPEEKSNAELVKKRIQGENRILTWCSDFEIGVSEIDEEHKQIIDHFEKLYELMKTGHGHDYYNELIQFLEYYVIHHFKHEETLQQKIGYGDFEHHKKLHAEFKTQVEALMSHYDASNVTNADLVRLNLYIKNWLSEHILIEDKKISRFISESNGK